MFIRTKSAGGHTYLQIVENQREDGKIRQRVLCNLGRLDLMQATGQIDALIASGIKFTKTLHVLDAHKKGLTQATTRTLRIGPALLFEKAWRQLGIPSVLDDMTSSRRFKFSIERALFLTVLHRLFSPGSDRAAEKWKRDYLIEGAETLGLHHLYRAMFWLGGELPDEDQGEGESLFPRCRKDAIEEALFHANRDLFTDVSLVFFDTTSLYFEGEGGDLLGQRGYSKDHRPDLYQLVVGIVLDNRGNPICSEILPGNTTDVTTLIPVATRLKNRFGIQKICVVADRGMISEKTVGELEKLGWEYILGVRMRRVREVREEVLTHFGNFRVINGPRKKAKDPSPLKVKEVVVEGTRYIVCHNEEQAEKDRHDREAILQALQDKLKEDDKALVGNKGFRRYLNAGEHHFVIDEKRVEEDELFDGKWVLTTNTGMAPADVALKYKDLLMVEHIFRTMKSVMDTRPIYHKCDETITGHVFCSFLALKLRKHLQDRLLEKNWTLEWQDIVHDVDEMTQVEVEHDGGTFTVRSETKGVAGKVFQAMGIGLPSVLQSGKSLGTTPVPMP